MAAIGCEAAVKIVNPLLSEGPSALIAGKRAPTGLDDRLWETSTGRSELVRETVVETTDDRCLPNRLANKLAPTDQMLRHLTLTPHPPPVFLGCGGRR